MPELGICLKPHSLLDFPSFFCVLGFLLCSLYYFMFLLGQRWVFFPFSVFPDFCKILHIYNAKRGC